MVYIIIIVGGMALITLINWLFDPTLAAAGQLALSTLFGTVSVIAWDGVVALLIRRLPWPKGWFAPERAMFYAGRRERALYRKMLYRLFQERILLAPRHTIPRTLSHRIQLRRRHPFGQRLPRLFDHCAALVLLSRHRFANRACQHGAQPPTRCHFAI